MSTVYPVAATEDGYVTPGPTWDGTSPFYTLPADGSLLAGLRFTGFPVTVATRTRPPSPIYTPRETYTAVSLRVAKSTASTGTLTVRLTPASAPDAFGPANLPDAAAGTVVAMRTLDAATGPVTVPLNLAVLTPHYRRSTWPGTWALTLQWTGTGDLGVTSREGADALIAPNLAPALLVDAVPEMSGLETNPAAQSRTDRCPRCGQPSLRETWVVDGYGKTYVCPQCYDPPDPLWHRRVPRPIRPGINDAG